ncbi:MAG: hypothetical protein U1F61_01790 [Opitutaceae bacterium]
MPAAPKPGLIRRELQPRPFLMTPTHYAYVMITQRPGVIAVL